MKKNFIQKLFFCNNQNKISLNRFLPLNPNPTIYINK